LSSDALNLAKVTLNAASKNQFPQKN